MTRHRIMADKAPYEMTIEGMFEPLIKGLPKEHRGEALQIIRQEDQSGMLSWAIDTGYLLWTRENPGVIPSMAQIIRWFVASKSLREDSVT